MLTKEWCIQLQVTTQFLQTQVCKTLLSEYIYIYTLVLSDEIVYLSGSWFLPEPYLSPENTKETILDWWNWPLKQSKERTNGPNANDYRTMASKF